MKPAKHHRAQQERNQRAGQNLPQVQQTPQRAPSPDRKPSPSCSTLLLCELAGISVSTGWMAGVRGKAAGLVEASGFMEHIQALLKTAPAVHADETPARTAGGTRYLHLACTRS